MSLSNSKTDIDVDGYTLVIHPCFSKSNSFLLNSAIQFQVSIVPLTSGRAAPF